MQLDLSRLSYRFLSLITGVFIGLWVPVSLALNLQETYLLAQTHDANYLSALARYEAAKINLPLANTGRRPDINASAGVTQNYDTFTPDGGESNSVDARRSQLALNLNQNLYNKSVRHDIESAEIGLEIAQLQLAMASEELIALTVERYLAVLAALDNQTLAELERTAIERQLDLATQRLEVGLGTKTDQFDAQARFESSNAGLIVAESEVLDAQQALEALMNRRLSAELGSKIRKLDNTSVALGSKKSEFWVESARQNNLAYLIKQLEVSLQKIEVERAEDGRSPTLAFVAGVSTSDTGESLQSSGSQENWNIGLQGSIPIYVGGAIKLQHKKSGHDLNAVKFAQEQVRRDTDRTARSAYRGVQALDRQVAALEQAVRASESALEAKEEGFKAGVTTNLDVLDGQRDLFRSRRDYLKVSYDLVNAIVQLERVAGSLDMSDIERINSWLK